MRQDGRENDELRQVKITRNYIDVAEGSVLFEMGKTRVLCNATVEDKVPNFLKDSGTGWVTAEYSMLPRATDKRSPRESSLGRVGGRTHEIQRLIGRSLRSVVNLKLLGERTIWVDCDVLRADGGTRTAAITGACICLADALTHMLDTGMVQSPPLLDTVAAVSVGVIGGEPVLDLCYKEDYAAEVDMNIVMTGGGDFVEVQGTAEGPPFSQQTLDALISFARGGIERLTGIQRAQLERPA